MTSTESSQANNDSTSTPAAPEVMSAVSIETYIKRNFGDSRMTFNQAKIAMAKHFKLRSQQITRWLGTAVVINDAIYLPKSDFLETPAETRKRIEKLNSSVSNVNKDVTCVWLEDHIIQEYGGNETAFAQANGTTQQQTFRWTNLAKCVYLCDQVYRFQHDLEIAQ